MDKYEIERVLVLSTGHMTYADSLRLAGVPYYPYWLVVHDLEYGWDVHVVKGVEQLAELQQYNWSPAFVGCMLKAAELGCDWLKFDQDGPVYESLPQHEW